MSHPPSIELAGGGIDVPPPAAEGRSAGVRHVMLRWAGRGLWAVADQGLFAISNFAMGVLLARWLSPAEFGGFSVAYALFLFLGVLHTALLTEPMLVFGSAKYASAFPGYLARLVKWHWVVAGVGGVVLALAGLLLQVVWSSPVAPTVISIGLMAPFILLPWLARRACFARLQPQWAAIGGGIYLLLMLLGALALFSTGSLSAVTATLLLGACGLVVGAGLVHALIRGRRRGRGDADVREVREVLADHWRYGRWALLASAVGWFPSNIYVLLLPAEGGLALSAALRALMNLVMPVLHAVGALSTLLLPSLVRVRETPAFRTALVTALVLFTGGTVVYWLLVATFANPLLTLLYKERYAEHAHLMWSLGALPVVAAIAGVLGAAVRALERPSDAFIASLGAAGTAATLGLWLVFRYGIAGAITGLIASSLATGLVLLVLLLKQQRSTRSRATGHTHA